MIIIIHNDLAIKNEPFLGFNLPAAKPAIPSNSFSRQEEKSGLNIYLRIERHHSSWHHHLLNGAAKTY